MYLIRSTKGTYQTLGQFTADERRLLLKKNTGARFALRGDACATSPWQEIGGPPFIHLSQPQLSRVLSTTVRKLNVLLSSITITQIEAARRARRGCFCRVHGKARDPIGLLGPRELSRVPDLDPQRETGLDLAFCDEGPRLSRPTY